MEILINMPKRKIIEIDEEKCNGCGVCTPNRPEGAIQIIDGKARLISDIFCDGLGACIGKCPQGAIETIAVFEGMNPGTALVHYEKGSPDYDGIYKAINQETAKLLQPNFKFINRESDMGIPGLRKAKLSYKPHHMVEVFHVDRQSLSF